MKALVMRQPAEIAVESVDDPVVTDDDVLLQVRMVGLCGSDLNSYRGKNPMVTYPRVPGHEVSATIVQASKTHPHFSLGMNVTLSPYSQCGKCPSCLRGRPNACQFNETLGVQRNGALAEFLAISPAKLYTANLSLKELCLVEPLTVGFHAVARGRVMAEDTVAIIGCGGRWSRRGCGRRLSSGAHHCH